MNTVNQYILNTVAKSRPGSIFFNGDFRGFGSEAAIKTTLSRLVKEDMLERIAKGIYVKPKMDPDFGKTYPPLEQIAQALAEREHVRIRPAGTYAINILGLSQQVPTKLVYITDGPPRTIKLGRRTIVFKPTTAKKLALKGEISGLIILALEELGKEAVTPEMIERIKDLLKKESPEILNEDMKRASGWISDLLFKIQKDVQ